MVCAVAGRLREDTVRKGEAGSSVEDSRASVDRLEVTVSMDSRTMYEDMVPEMTRLQRVQQRT
jgi:hypothetical protein